MRLTDEKIGDNLDLEVEVEYRCSNGSVVMTVSVDRLLDAQIAECQSYYASLTLEKVREEVKESVCGNCKMQGITVCGACQIDFVKATDQILSLLGGWMEEK